jgi:hypothetical protein
MAVLDSAEVVGCLAYYQLHAAGLAFAEAGPGRSSVGHLDLEVGTVGEVGLGQEGIGVGSHGLGVVGH